MSVRMVDETMPPIIGTAMYCMTSEPVPWLQKIGRSPAMRRLQTAIRAVLEARRLRLFNTKCN